MKKKSLSIVILLISVALAILSFTNKKKNRENLEGRDSLFQTIVEVKKSEIDLGVIKTNQEAKSTFVIYNKGGMQLTIDRVETTCHCTSGTLQKNGIVSGDSALIDVLYDKHAPGFFYQDVRIYGNFINSPLIVSFQGFVDLSDSN